MRRLSARVRANRLNARKSTGPKSAAGKTRSAKNAYRHGLAIAVATVPELAGPIEELARCIAGPDASAEHLSLARVVAQAEIDLGRIRQARLVLLTDPKARIVEPTAAEMLGGMRAITGLVPWLISGLGPEPPRELTQREASRLLHVARLKEAIDLAAAPPDLIEALPVVLPKLMRFDRYEQRVRSRRRKAIADLRMAQIVDEPD